MASVGRAAASLPPPPPQPLEHRFLLPRSAQMGGEAAAEESENIPYHARDYAQPFTYGSLPAGFQTSDLNHVVVEEVAEATKSVRTRQMSSPSPSTMRKSTRPSISPSRPVLRKTPTRQEFEVMLLERREQALREQRTFATQQAQNAAIQKDLDELQQILNETISLRPTEAGHRKPALQNAADEFHLQDESSVQSTHSQDPHYSHREHSDNQTQQRAVVLYHSSQRSETPAFPAESRRPLDDRCVSPYPMVTPGTPTLQRIHPHTPDSALVQAAKREPTPRREVGEPLDVAPHLVKFAKDYSEFWYKPHMTREDAVALLRNAAPGTFIIRNSTTYKNAYGLVLRVDKPPQGVACANGDELVRHYLVEPTTRGVRLKGCPNEPVFTSLSALAYQHSISAMALPVKLVIPEHDLLLSAENAELANAQKLLLRQGAACNVLYLYSCGMESLTGEEAIRKAVGEMFSQRPLPQPAEVHFKVSQQGITLTDNTRRLFFRRHYAPYNISHFGIDPEIRLWSVAADDEGLSRTVNKTIFGFVARPLAGSNDNQCHVFCDMAASQPASAIVSFANKVVPMDKRNHSML